MRKNTLRKCPFLIKVCDFPDMLEKIVENILMINNLLILSIFSRIIFAAINITCQ